MKRLLIITALAGMTAFASSASAQSLSVSVRGGGGLPIGDFSEAAATGGSDALLGGAKRGFGLGLDAALSLGSTLGIYAGFDQVRFDCEDATCGSDGEYKMGGFTAGIQLTPVRLGPLAPWIRGGVTFHELQGTYGSQGTKFSSEREPGYELGAGVNVPILGILAISPQLRYVGQNTRLRVPGVEAPEAKQNLGYFVFDLGLGFATGGRR